MGLTGTPGVPFRTARLLLRELTTDDIGPLHAILSDPETMAHYPAPYTRPEVEAWVERSRLSYREYGHGLWAVIRQEGNLFLGQCGLVQILIDGERVPEIGYQIDRRHWGLGYATEAARACLVLGFEVFRYPRLFIHTSVKNAASRRVAEKLGFRPVKEFDKWIERHRMSMRHIVYTLERNEYAAPPAG